MSKIEKKIEDILADNRNRHGLYLQRVSNIYTYPLSNIYTHPSLVQKL